jgi:hypothetical protein
LPSDSPPSCVSKRGNFGPTREAGDTERPRHSNGDITIPGSIWYKFGRYKRVLRGVAGMTQEHRLALIIETIRALQIGLPVSRGRMTLLLEPWPGLYHNAMARRGAGWINLLQAAAARVERAL